MREFVQRKAPSLSRTRIILPFLRARSRRSWSPGEVAIRCRGAPSRVCFYSSPGQEGLASSSRRPYDNNTIVHRERVVADRSRFPRNRVPGRGARRRPPSAIRFARPLGNLGSAFIPIDAWLYSLSNAIHCNPTGTGVGEDF